MDDLIEALTILRKYGNPKHPTTCEHDELRVLIPVAGVTPEDRKRLGELGFFSSEDEDDDDVGADDAVWMSFRFGSA